MIHVVGIDPGGRQSGVVARDGTRPVFACTITREGADAIPGAGYFSEVTAAIADALALFADDDELVIVAVEGVVQPTGHVGMMNVVGLLGTAMVLGAVLAAYPAAVVVPPGGHGSGPLRSYPASLCGPRELKGRGRFRHVRSAYDVAGAGAYLSQSLRAAPSALEPVAAAEVSRAGAVDLTGSTGCRPGPTAPTNRPAPRPAAHRRETP